MKILPRQSDWETTFDQDTRDRTLLDATLLYLSERVGSKLREKSRKARCITLKVRSADFNTTTRRRTLEQATDADQAIFTTGLELLKRELFIQKRAIRLNRLKDIFPESEDGYKLHTPSLSR